MSEPNCQWDFPIGNDSNRADLEREGPPPITGGTGMIDRRDEADLLELPGLPECIVRWMGYTSTDRFVVNIFI